MQEHDPAALFEDQKRARQKRECRKLGLHEQPENAHSGISQISIFTCQENPGENRTGQQDRYGENPVEFGAVVAAQRKMKRCPGRCEPEYDHDRFEVLPEQSPIDNAFVCIALLELS